MGWFSNTNSGEDFCFVVLFSLIYKIRVLGIPFENALLCMQ